MTVMYSPDGDYIDDLVQDPIDGKALRWLREALPVGRRLIVEYSKGSPDPDGLEHVTWCVNVRRADGGVLAHRGRTVAEAADKCREALEKA